MENLKEFYLKALAWMITILCALPGFAVIVVFVTVVIIYITKEVNFFIGLLW